MSGVLCGKDPRCARSSRPLKTFSAIIVNRIAHCVLQVRWYLGFLLFDTYSFMCGSVLRGAAKNSINAAIAVT